MRSPVQIRAPRLEAAVGGLPTAVFHAWVTLMYRTNALDIPLMSNHIRGAKVYEPV